MRKSHPGVEAKAADMIRGAKNSSLIEIAVFVGLESWLLKLGVHLIRFRTHLIFEPKKGFLGVFPDDGVRIRSGPCLRVS